MQVCLNNQIAQLRVAGGGRIMRVAPMSPARVPKQEENNENLAFHCFFNELLAQIDLNQLLEVP